MARELISSGERDNEASEQPMNLAADGCWGGRGSSDASARSPQPCTGAGGLGGTRGAAPSLPCLQLGCSVSPVAVPAP